MGAERIQDKIELYRFKETLGTFTGVCTLIYDYDKVFVKGLHGSICMTDRAELKAHLMDNGVTKISFVHNEKHTTRRLK